MIKTHNLKTKAIDTKTISFDTKIITSPKLYEESQHIDRHIIKTRKIFRVGPGEFDFLGINRVKNTYSCPRLTIVAIPGANTNFDTSFDKLSIYLARLGIDVWGIDFRYSFVPDNFNSDPYCIVKDCGFMKDWDIDMFCSDIDFIVKMAELVSTEKVFLLGYSQGSFYVYKYAERNPNINGIIPIDITYNLDPANIDIINNIKAEIDRIKTFMDSGNYYEDVLAAKYMAYLAQIDPDGNSEIFPGMTNKQAYLFLMTATYQLSPIYPQGFIYCQGNTDQLKYTDYDYMIQKTLSTNNFQSIVTTYEMYNQWIDPTIPNITIPILHIYGEYGFKTYGTYTQDKLKEINPDVTIDVVSDHGHADVAWARDSADVWNKIYRWLIRHSR